MRVIVLVKATKDCEEGVPPSAELIAAMKKYNEELLEAGVLLAIDGLQPSSKGARVLFDGSKRTVIDGPFAESKELVGGYWIWKVQSIDEAVAWLKKAPFDSHAEAEIRPIREAEDFPIQCSAEARELGNRVREQVAVKN